MYLRKHDSEEEVGSLVLPGCKGVHEPLCKLVHFSGHFQPLNDPQQKLAIFAFQAVCLLGMILAIGTFISYCIYAKQRRRNQTREAAKKSRQKQGLVDFMDGTLSQDEQINPDTNFVDDGAMFIERANFFDESNEDQDLPPPDITVF